MTRLARRRLLACLGLSLGAASLPLAARANEVLRPVECRIPRVTQKYNGVDVSFSARAWEEDGKLDLRGDIVLPVAQSNPSRIRLRAQLGYIPGRGSEFGITTLSLELNPDLYRGNPFQPRQVADLMVETELAPRIYRLGSGSAKTREVWQKFHDGTAGVVWIHDPRGDFTDSLIDGRDGEYAFVRVQNQVSVDELFWLYEPQLWELRGRHEALSLSPGTTEPGAKLVLGCEISDDPCFFTTATVGAVGLPDDCFELQALRRFRDGPLAAMPGGAALIAQYYARAPGIVAAVNARPDAARVWRGVYRRYILPCAILARLGQARAALALYRRLVARLDRLAAQAQPARTAG